MDRGQALERRLQRLLSDDLEGARRDFRQAETELAARGLLASGARIKRLVELIERHAEAATTLLFREVDAQPGRISIWREDLAPFLRTQLSAHLQALTEASIVHRVAESANSEAANQSLTRLLCHAEQNLSAVCAEYEEGIWHDPTVGGAKSGDTHNTVNVGGSVSGVVQQGGASATQGASLTAPDSGYEQALAALEAALQHAELDAEEREDALSDVATIKAQLRKRRPDEMIISAALNALTAISYGIAGNLVTPHVETLAHALGL